MTQFTDTSASIASSGLGAKASATNAARKILSRLHLGGESKSLPPCEGGEKSTETDPPASAASPGDINEESAPVITKVSSEDKKLLNAGDHNISDSEKSDPTETAKNLNPKSSTSATDSEVSEAALSKPESRSAKQPSQPNHNHQPRDGVSLGEGRVRAKKPAVKVRPQQIAVGANPSSSQEQLVSGERTKRELSSHETSNGTGPSLSPSLSTSASRVSSVIQRIQNSQTPQQEKQPAPNITSRKAPKPAVATKRGPGPTYPCESIPGPIKPRLVRKTAPSSHSSRAPQTLSVSNMDNHSRLSLLTSSLPGLTECSKEELELLSQLFDKAAGSDYYSLLGAHPDATMEELARARREKTRVLHPDHFGNDPERQAR